MPAIKLTTARLRNQIITLVASLYGVSRSAVKIKEEPSPGGGTVLGYYVTVNGTTEEFGGDDRSGYCVTERQGLRRLRTAVMRRCQRVAGNVQSVLDSEDAGMIRMKAFVRRAHSFAGKDIREELPCARVS